MTMAKIPPVNKLYKTISKNSLKPNSVMQGGEIWHARYIGRKISIYFTWFFLHTNISPNAITLLSMFLGITACFLLSIPKLPALFTSFVMFELSLILDSTDGEVARHKKQYSILGDYIDTIAHILIYITLFISLGINILYRTGNVFYLILGISTALVFTLGAIIHHIDPILKKSDYLKHRSKDSKLLFHSVSVYNFLIEDLNIVFAVVIFGALQYLNLLNLDIFKIVLWLNFVLIFFGGVVFNLTRKFFDPRYQ